MTNLAIVSDIRLYREGLGRILNETYEINIVGLIESYNGILKLLEINQLDVVLLDMRMANNIEIISAISKNHTNVKIIVLAVPENDDSYLLCVESGIAGYLSIDSTVDDLVESIKTVTRGKMYCPCSITQYILKCVKHKHDDNKVKEAKFTYSKLLNVLTQREMQIVKLLAEGMSNKKIAKNLAIELSTVKNHVHNILVKMGVESRSQVACLLQENFLVKRNRSIDLDPQLDLH